MIRNPFRNSAVETCIVSLAFPSLAGAERQLQALAGCAVVGVLPEDARERLRGLLEAGLLEAERAERDRRERVVREHAPQPPPPPPRRRAPGAGPPGGPGGPPARAGAPAPRVDPGRKPVALDVLRAHLEDPRQLRERA